MKLSSVKLGLLVLLGYWVLNPMDAMNSINTIYSMNPINPIEEQDNV